jgi:hypothetical protein
LTLRFSRYNPGFLNDASMVWTETFAGDVIGRAVIPAVMSMRTIFTEADRTVFFFQSGTALHTIYKPRAVLNGAWPLSK